MEQEKQLKPRPKMEFSEEDKKKMFAHFMRSQLMRQQYQKDVEYREKRIKETMERILSKQNLVTNNIPTPERM